MSQAPIRRKYWRKQDDFCKLIAPICVFLAGIATGKTYAGAEFAYRHWLPTAFTYLLIAPSYRTALDVMVPVCMESWAPYEPEFKRSDMIIGFRHSRAMMMLRSADQPDKLRGPSVAGAWIDELSLCRGGVGGTMDITLGRLRQGGKLGRLIATTTPKQTSGPAGKARKVKREDIKALINSPGVAIIRAKTRENPFIARAFYDLLRLRYTSKLAKQELEGDENVTLGAGLCDPDWFLKVPSAPAGLRWYRYFDLAFAQSIRADRTATAKCAFDAATNLAYFGGFDAARVSFGNLPDWIEGIVREDMQRGDVVEWGIESNAMGSEAYKQIEPRLRAVSVRSIARLKDKIDSFSPVLARAEKAIVRVMQEPNTADCLGECGEFPDGDHDDYPDALSGAWAMAAQPRADYTDEPATSGTGAAWLRGEAA